MRLSNPALALVAVLLLAACAAAPQREAAPEAIATDTAADVPRSLLTPQQVLERIVSRLQGEWGNHQQRWLLGQTEGAAQVPQLHYSIVPLQAPKVGRRLFLVQQSGGGLAEGQVRLRIWRFALERSSGAVRQDVYAFKQPDRYIALLRAGQQPELRHQDLIPSPGCSLLWQAAADGGWAGVIDGQDCLLDQRPGVTPRYVNDQLSLKDDLLVVESRSGVVGQPPAPAVVLQLQRASQFSGWLAINPAGPTARSGDAQRPWHTRNDLRLHDGGQRLEVLWDDGSPSGWSLELARLHYANADQPILRLDLIEDQSGRVLTYVWSGAESSQIGMNLGWFQVGLTRERP